MVVCPICNHGVKTSEINNHIDSGCKTFLVDESGADSQPNSSSSPPISSTQNAPPPPSTQKKRTAAAFFQTPATKRQAITNGPAVTPRPFNLNGNANGNGGNQTGKKRSWDEANSSPSYSRTNGGGAAEAQQTELQQQQQASADSPPSGPVAKRSKTSRAAPMAERMRPHSLDEVFGQDLVGPNGVLRSLIEADRVPSMILWGGSGTGKTTIARCIARKVDSRFIELNATSTGVAEVKKYFTEAANELALTGRKTIIFCDEIHRFSKSQQDVFLKPVEAGTITLIGATTENPSFKVQSALLSRCRTFTLQTLTQVDIQRILLRALQQEVEQERIQLSPLIDEELLTYLSAFADGDARTALNLLELALSLTARPTLENGAPLTKEDIKASLTKTLVYDRAGDQHYDTISAFHKSVRGSDPDAALYYLARMLQSGEDPLFIARRMVVIASEDVGLADNTLLPLATATYTATQQIGMPEARIPLAHCTVALCLAPKSTRAYRGLNNAFSALQEPGVASLPVPLHLRNAPTRLMREMGYGAEYKYPPNYREGKVRQEYLPEGLRGRRFLEERDLGTEVDPDVDMDSEGI
ncbi:putative AAA family ATPase [Cladorrhinum sp. PSN259]|nr:putative AAA family ATPase [Cladorrhinum sp. PSN259]